MPAVQILLGTRKGLLTFTRTEGAWQVTAEAHLGARVPYAAVDPRSGIIFANLDHDHWGSKLHRSRDSGKTWEEIPAPIYPTGAELKDGKPAVLRYLWCMAPGGEDQPGRIYLGTEPGGLFVSDDHGDSFHLVESLWNHPSRKEQWMGGGLDEPGIHSILVDPRNSRRLLVGISVAGVFATDDDGQTWQPRNRGLKADFMPDPDIEIGHDPHLVVRCQSQPDKLWQQNHCGIFRSIDEGANWTRVSQSGGPAHFGFAVVVDPADGETAWVVPADSDEVRVAVDRRFCVSRTTDGGQSWQDLRQGLPQRDCYDFTFRHALDIAGDSLAVGTAGGCLFLSDDRGDHWQTIGRDLPPIYSVRFSTAG